ncbi:MAG: hypothetical protein HY821_05965 [Acidobacteria bacterium]|nr:hypothetical protein [Acidobacteriota bacterium]
MPDTPTEPEILLLARDETLEREVRHALRGFRLRISVIASAEDCRRALCPGRPQLLVLEHSQVRTGWREPVRECLNAEVPVIVVTARFDSRQWVDLFKAGVLDVIASPLPAQQLQLLVYGLFRCRWNVRERGDERAMATLRRVGAWLGL